MISYTEAFDLGAQFAIADLALDAATEAALRAALDSENHIE